VMQEARAFLAQSTRPLAIAGVDAVNEEAGEAVAAFCHTFRVPLITSYKGKGLLDEADPLAIGGAGLSPRADRMLLPVLSDADLILLLGGLFLIFKTVKEMHEQIVGEHHLEGSRKPITFAAALVQIALLDLVFSLDSVITAVGMVDDVRIMIGAVIIAVGVMVTFADRISNFVSAHPTLKVLALSFLLLIGVMLLAEGIGTHVEKGYIYFAMAFSLFVEFLNMKVRSKAEPAPAVADV